MRRGDNVLDGFVDVVSVEVECEEERKKSSRVPLGYGGCRTIGLEWPPHSSLPIQLLHGKRPLSSHSQPQAGLPKLQDVLFTAH